MAVTATTATAAVLITHSPSSALAALAIEPNGRWVEIQIVDADASEERMSSDLRAAGIDGEVKLIPATTKNVDEWMGLQRVSAKATGNASSGERPPAWDADQIAAHEGVLRIRHDVLARFDKGRWVFYIGRDPREHEPPQKLFSDGPREVDDNPVSGMSR